MEGFLRYEFGGLIFGGAYFRNFTVCYIDSRFPAPGTVAHGSIDQPSNKV